MPATARLTIKMQMFTHALNLVSRGCCTNFDQFVQKSAVSGCFWKALRVSLTAFAMLRFSTDEDAPLSGPNSMRDVLPFGGKSHKTTRNGEKMAIGSEFHAPRHHTMLFARTEHRL